jgi:hypothetical protein
MIKPIIPIINVKKKLKKYLLTLNSSQLEQLVNVNNTSSVNTILMNFNFITVFFKCFTTIV